MTAQCEAPRSNGAPCGAAHGQWIHRAADDPEMFVPCAVDGRVDYCLNRDIWEAAAIHDWRPDAIRVVVVEGLCQLHRRRGRMQQRAGVAS